MTLTIKRTNSLVLTCKHQPVTAGWHQTYYLGADLHLDSPQCDRKMLFRHLDEAIERDARILLFGDTNDVMQGREDKRRAKGELKEKLTRDDYFDAVVDETEEDLEKYRDLIVLMSIGNHEDEALMKYGTNVCRRVAKRLEAEYFGYAGFVRFKFSGAVGHRTSRLLYFHHGGGGGGEVTRGIIKTNRRQVYLPDPDIIVSGHIHDAWLMPIARVRLSASDEMYRDKLYHVQMPSYKDEWGGDRGFTMRREAPPKPLGAWWMTFKYDSAMRDNIRIIFEMAE